MGLQPGDVINRGEFAVFYGADPLYPDRWEQADVLLRYTGDGRAGNPGLLAP